MDEPTDSEFERIMARINAITRRIAADRDQTEIDCLLSLADEYDQMADYLECHIDVKPHYEEVAEVHRVAARSIREIFDGTASEASIPSEPIPPRDRLH